MRQFIDRLMTLFLFVCRLVSLDKTTHVNLQQRVLRILITPDVASLMLITLMVRQRVLVADLPQLMIAESSLLGLALFQRHLHHLLVMTCAKSVPSLELM